MAETNLTKYVLRSYVFSFTNNSSISSGKAFSSLIPVLESSMVLIFSEGIERERCSRVNKFCGVLEERV